MDDLPDKACKRCGIVIDRRNPYLFCGNACEQAHFHSLGASEISKAKEAYARKHGEWLEPRSPARERARERAQAKRHENGRAKSRAARAARKKARK